jgi:L-seryl-tRNA(Ser) seleniumtransferase
MSVTMRPVLSVGYNGPREHHGFRQMTTGFRDLPSVDLVLSDGRIQRLVEQSSRPAVLELVRAQLEEARDAIGSGRRAATVEEVVSAVEARAATRWRAWPNAVINATGVILHTNLGRAPLSGAALRAVERTAGGYSDLELDLETGKRGSRQAHISQLICQATGAPAAIAVNNNASAVLLGLAAIAAGKEVIVSRGEAVEIGGGFRIPDVLRQSGAKLIEVGSTNRTYVRDYEASITDNTGALLSVHTSNFRVSGFTHSPSLAELVKLGKDKGVPVLHDLGSGCLLDTAEFGLAHEPMPQESMEAGASLAFFSGDKLLGGPQSGMIVGDEGLVASVSRHPLARAVRIDKLSMAALSATLLHYIKDEATVKIPIWRMIAESEDSVKSRASRWASSLGERATLAGGLSTIGGGSLPGEVLPTTAVALDTGDAEGLAMRLRTGSPAVIGRIEDDRVLLDPRTVLPAQEESLLRVVSQALGKG